MRLRFLIMAATALSAASLSARADNIVTYSFGGNLNPQVQDGITATGFSGDGGSKAVIGTGDNDGSYGYILVTKDSNSIGDAVSNKQFAQFTISPPQSAGMQIVQFQIQAGRGASTSPRGIALRWSFDNYQSNLGQADVTKTWPGTNTITFNVNSFAGSPVTFRIYAYAKDSQAEASIRFDNITVTGYAIIYPPSVTPSNRVVNVSRSTTSTLVTGTAYSSVGIRRVEFSKTRYGVYSGANGTSSWNFTATSLRYGRNVFFVRSIANDGQYSPASRITIFRSRQK